MSDDKRSLWSTMPGVIGGIAAIVTGLAALVPILLGVSHAKRTSVAATSSPTPSATASPTPGTSPSAAPGDPGTPTASSVDGSPNPDLTPGPGAGDPAGGSARLTATPPSVAFGSVGIGHASAVTTITIANSGPAGGVIDTIALSGPNAGQFSIASTTCGGGARLAPQASCQIGLRFNPTAIAPAAASLDVAYHGPSATESIPLAGTGSLL